MSSRLLAPLLALAVCGPLLAQEEGKEQPSLSEQLTRFRDDLLSNSETIQLDGMSVKVTVIPDYFLLLAAEELLEIEDLNEREADDLKDRVARLAGRKAKTTMGKPAVFFRFHHPEGARRDFFCFEGKLNDCIRARAVGKVRFTPISSEGDMPRAQRFMLFKPNLSEAWGPVSNGRPHMPRTLNMFGSEPLEIRFVVKKGFSERAEELEISVGNLIHVSGSGITDDQIDFKNGASASYPRGESATFPLPCRAPELPSGLVELLPEWEGD